MNAISTETNKTLVFNHALHLSFVISCNKSGSTKIQYISRFVELFKLPKQFVSCKREMHYHLRRAVKEKSVSTE